jgi:hypothetical protein
MVEPKTKSLENRKGPIGPSGVRIPPPPLTTRIPSNDAGSSKREAGLEPASRPLETARNRHRVSRDCRAATSRSEQGRRVRARDQQRRTVVDANGRAPNQRTGSGDSKLAHADVLA